MPPPPTHVEFWSISPAGKASGRCRSSGRGGCCAATLTATAAHEPGYRRPTTDCFCTSRTCTDGTGRNGQNLQAGGRWFEPNRAHQHKQRLSTLTDSNGDSNEVAEIAMNRTVAY
jgi:hypothetical protein